MTGFRPAYLETLAKGELARKVEQGLEALRSCRVCPRDCDADRLSGEVGICKTGRHAVISSAFPHLGEEDCLRGSRGSGTIFLCHCNLRCVFCQNMDISWRGDGQELLAREVASLALRLQDMGCHNINFVTPEHAVPQILEAIFEAAQRGLRIPIVYNTSAYDSLASLKLLDGVVDIYMPDFKVWDPQVAKRLLFAEDYPEVARVALREMHRQVGDLALDAQGLAQRGLLVRHLVMPRGLADTRAVMRFLARELSQETFVNLMDQYRPEGKVLERPDRYVEIGRRVSRDEMEDAYTAAREEGLHRFDQRQRRFVLLG
jgi:putative pyruvate formate lyase activating enzyme